MAGNTKEPCAYEIGSNAFGSAVLLPDFLLRKRCEGSPSLDVPWQITKEYDPRERAPHVSLVDLDDHALRYVTVTSGQLDAAIALAFGQQAGNAPGSGKKTAESDAI